MKKTFILLTMLITAFMASWAQDSPMFSATPLQTLTATVQFDQGETEINSNYGMVSGGTFYFTNADTSSKDAIAKQSNFYAFDITGGKQGFKVVLSVALTAGDIISADVLTNGAGDSNSRGLWLTTATSRPSAAPTCTLIGSSTTGKEYVNVEYTVVENDGLCGETTFYIWRATSNTTYFKDFQIANGAPLTLPRIDTNPLSAEYEQDATAAALTVEATASAGELSYQWYTCDDVNKTNATAISEATTASYTPSTATIGTFYFFCRVTDENGYTDSDVATIEVTEVQETVGSGTLFLWQSDGSTTSLDTSLTCTGGTAMFKGTDAPSTESAEYNAAVTDSELKATGSKAHKLGKNTLYMEITLSQKLQSGDIIYVSGYNTFRVGTGQTDNRANTDLAESLTTGTSKTDYNVGSIVIPSSIGDNVTKIYLSRAEGSGTGLAAVKIVRPAESDVVATPTLPESDNFKDSKEITITCTTPDATILYSTDNGTSWTTYTEPFTITETTTIQAKATKEGKTDSEVATATYTKVVVTPHEWATVETASTWDWTTLSADWTSDLNCSTYDDFVFADFDGLNLDGTITFPETFDATAIKILTGSQYPFRSNNNKYLQNGKFKIQTSVPGKLDIQFSNTGSNNKGRYVVITDTEGTTTGSVEADGTTKRDETFYVSAGEITLDFTNNGGIRLYKVVFTPMESVQQTITSAGWASFSSKFEVAIPEGVTAYIASKKGESTVTLTELSGTIPANTGVVLSGNAGTYEAAITQTGATLSETNYLLPWLTEGTPTEDVYYTLAVSEGNPVFKKSSGGTLAAGKAYLVLPTEANVVNVLFGGDATGIGNEALRMMNQRSAPTGKANEESRGSIYDLQGRLVSRGYEGTEVRGYENSLVEGEEGNLTPSHPRTLAPSIKKGIYVVNGRKVVVK